MEWVSGVPAALRAAEEVSVFTPLTLHSEHPWNINIHSVEVIAAVGNKTLAGQTIGSCL